MRLNDQIIQYLSIIIIIEYVNKSKKKIYQISSFVVNMLLAII
jgi:hypothetical protein